MNAHMLRLAQHRLRQAQHERICAYLIAGAIKYFIGPSLQNSSVFTSSGAHLPKGLRKNKKIKAGSFPPALSF
jgi:hypothetical protein